MKPVFKRRKEERESGGMLPLLQRYAQTLIALAVAGGLVISGLNHFATAADVEKKFTSIKVELKGAVLEARKARIEDELFRLRSDTKQRGTDPQIQRYEAELRDVSARLRDLEKQK